MNGVGLENSKPERGINEMSEEEKTETEQVEELLKISTSELRVERDGLAAELERKEARIKDLEEALARANDHIESETKAKLVGELKVITNYGDEYLQSLSVSRLKQLSEDYKYVKLPKFKSSGDLGSKSDPYEKLHTMYKFGKT